MSLIESLVSKNLPAPRFRYSSIVKAGPHYYTAGLIALDKDSGLLELGGAYKETKKILDNLLSALPDFGLTLSDMVSARIFTTQLTEFASINEAWEEVFVEGISLPARTTIGVSALPLEACVEMEFVFYRSKSS